MSLRVIRPGVLDSFQDGGRYGFQHWGINPGGAMDVMALQVANFLAGNDAFETALEMHFPAPELYFETTALIAVSGADFSATVNGDAIPPNSAFAMPAGGVLKFLSRNTGARQYLAVSGGFNLQEWLGSTGTNLKVNAGGMGRALKKDDRITLKHATRFHSLRPGRLPWRADTASLYPEGPIQFIAGAEYDLMNEAGKSFLEEQNFIVGLNSDRMGYRLQGMPVTSSAPGEIISTAVTRGTMQQLPDGQLIVLVADHQTTGGYPRVGHVITAFLPVLAQRAAGEIVKFRLMNLEAAEAAMFAQQRNLQQLQNACTFRLEQYLSR